MIDIKDWWVSNKIFTCWVRTRGNIIIDAAPIAKRWVGQSFSRFMAYYGSKKEELKDDMVHE
jgi:hypothetical protein